MERGKAVSYTHLIAPISSWAAAVTSSVPADSGINGFAVFIQTIPYNLYALLTLVMLIGITLLRVDFGPMKTHEMNAIKGDLFTTPGRPYEDNEEEVVKENSHVLDLILPVAVLIVSCIVAMIYTGGFFSGTSFVEAFSGCDASVGLVLGGAVTLVFTCLLYTSGICLSLSNITDVLGRFCNLLDTIYNVSDRFSSMVCSSITFSNLLKGTFD